jgi:NADH-quinone oxidoreductase subunit J
MDLIGDIAKDFDLVVFMIIGLITIFSAVMMLESKNLSHAIIFLALTFAGVGVIYILLNAEFIAMIQMSVYTGGVVILFLFALMLTRSEEFNLRGDLNRNVSVLFAFLLISIFIFIILPLADLWVNNIIPLDVVNSTEAGGFPFGIAWVGFSLFNYYQIGFIILGFIVVAALVGTIYIVKNEPGEDPRVVSPANPNPKED